MTCAWSLRGCFLIQLGKKPPQAALWMFVSRSISTDHEDMLADVSDSLCGPAAATCAWSLHNFGSLLHYVKNPCKDEITCPVPAVVCNNNTTGADICRKSVRRRRADIGGTMLRHRRWGDSARPQARLRRHIWQGYAAAAPTSGGLRSVTDVGGTPHVLRPGFAATSGRATPTPRRHRLDYALP